MSAIGSLVFCTDCGNLLPASKGEEKGILVCDCCGKENKGAKTEQTKINKKFAPLHVVTV